jgi:hypothetical protein
VAGRSTRTLDDSRTRCVRSVHPNYRLNGPSNQVLRKAAVVQMLAQGQMASDRFDRDIEGIAITGNVGIAMGREVVRPSPGSQLGKLHGSRVLNRRYTNVFLFEGGKWRFRAHQATIVQSARRGVPAPASKSQLVRVRAA